MLTKQLKELLSRIKYDKHFANANTHISGSLLDLADSDVRSWYGTEGREIPTTVYDLLLLLLEEAKAIQYES